MFYSDTLSRMSRRQLLNAAWKLGAAAVLQPVTRRRVFAQPVFGTYPFTLGVASGDPLPDGVVLWTRLAPEPLDGGGMPMANVEVGWEIARDRAFRTIVQKGDAVARPELGHSVHVEVDGPAARARVLVPLPRRQRGQPDRPHEDRAGRGRRGRSTAFRGVRLQSLRDRLLHRVSPHRRRAVRLRVPHRRLHLRRSRRRRTNRRRVRQHNGEEILHRSSTTATATRCTSRIRDLIAAHASAPFVMTWDDHEVDNDYAGDVDENDTPPEIFLLRRAAAYQAYYETMPLRACGVAHRPRHAHVSPPAVRQPDRPERARHAAVPHRPGVRRRHGDRLRRRRSIRRGRCWAPSRSGGCSTSWRRCRATVDGDRPAGADRSRATCVGSESATAQYSMDKWDGYAAGAAAALRAAARNEGAEPDRAVRRRAHALRRRPEDGLSQSAIGDRSASSSRTRRSRRAATAPRSPRSGSRSARDNPHIKYHSARRGYIACTATPATMRADFKILDRVTVADRPIKTGGSVVVEAGRPGSGECLSRRARRSSARQTTQAPPPNAAPSTKNCSTTNSIAVTCMKRNRAVSILVFSVES